MTPRERTNRTAAQIDGVGYTAEQIRITIDRLRQSWAWLRLLVAPGRETSVGTAVDDQRAERLTAVGLQARAYRDWNLRQGQYALPPSPASARIGIVDAQVDVHGLVLTAVQHLARHLELGYVGRRNTVDQAVTTALDWLTGDAGEPGRRWIAGVDGVYWRTGPLDDLRHAGFAVGLDRDLQRADRIARTAARVLDDRVQPIEHRCPACGQRSLQLQYDGDDRRTWQVRCVSQRCRCAGTGEPGRPACGCHQRTRYAGRPHAWAYGELDGPYGLWAAIAAASLTRPRLAARTNGHGGWQSRDRAGGR